MASSGSIWVSLGLRTNEFRKGVSRAKKDLSGFQKFTSGMKGMFNPLTLGIGAVVGLGAAVSNGVKIFKDFEKANSDLEAVLGDKGTAGAMEALSSQAKRLGSVTAFTATEVSQLSKEFAKLGFDPTQIMNMTEATLNLAAAAGSELAEAAALAGSTINAFGLESKDARHVTDVMAASFAKSALDMEKFSETMKNAAPIARATGVSLELATAAAGKLADANISGSKAGTDLRKIFSELVKDGKPFQESLNDIAKEMNAAKTKAEKLGLAEKLVGERAKGALLVLVDQKDSLGELSTAFENADGTAKKMADTMLNNLEGSITKASSAYEGFVLSIEDGEGVISKSLKSVVDGFTIILQGLTLLNTEIKNSVEIEQLDNSFKKLSKSQLNNRKGVSLIIKSYIKAGLSTDEAKKKYFELRQELDKVSSSVPTDSVDEGTNSLLDMTEAEVKAAKKARLLASGLKDVKVSLGDLKIDTTELLADTVKDIEKSLSDGKKIIVPVQVELKSNQEEGDSGINGAMIERGEKAGELMAGALSSAAIMGLSGLGEAIGGGDVAEIGNSLIVGMADLLGQFGEQMITLGVAQAALAAALALGPLGAAVAIGAGVALIAASSAIKSGMQKSSAEPFAAGGLVTGSVFANIGEGRGTSRSNPEVVSPLDKLKKFMPDGGGGIGEVEFIIKGDTLVSILKRMNKINSYSN